MVTWGLYEAVFGRLNIFFIEKYEVSASPFVSVLGLIGGGCVIILHRLRVYVFLARQRVFSQTVLIPFDNAIALPAPRSCGMDTASRS